MINLGDAALNAAVNAVVDLLDAGGTIKVYTAPMPANPTIAISTQTLLATFTIPAPGYGASSVTGDIATAIGEAISAVNPDNAGSAAWARVENTAGDVVFDGDAGLTGSTAFARLSSLSLSPSVPVSVSSSTYSAPR